jgi:hypothetical protein
MRRYLVELPRSGDTVVFYDASHGSLRENSAGDKLTLRTGDNRLIHVDSTLVPSDAYKGGYDVRDKEMARIFNAALDKGVHLTVIFDSCHSGGSARGVGGRRERSLAYDPRPVNDPPDYLANGQMAPPPTERPVNPALVFTAVQQDQSAYEIDPSESSPEIHGAFTAALIETLQILPANAPASLVYQRVKAVLEGQGAVGEEPDLDANPVRREQPLFGGTANSGAAGKVRTAALKTDGDGSVWLDIGMVSGVGAGSEFTAIAPNAQGQSVRLRVKEALGIARCAAMVVSPSGAKVDVGEVFELTKFAPAQGSPLRFWIGPSNISIAEIATAVQEIKRSGVVTIADPAEETYTDVLRWDGAAWTVQHTAPVRASQAISVAPELAVPRALGATLSGAKLKQALAPGALLWVDLPASAELAARLSLMDPTSAAQAATSESAAHYLLAGSLIEGRPAYAWFHRDEIAAGPRRGKTMDHSPGCSTTSRYPVRSEWVPAEDSSAIPKTSESLKVYSMRLSRVHGWLELANNTVSGASAANFYKLALLPLAGGGPIDLDQPLHENDRLRLALQSNLPVKNPRWVYVLDIDCRGTGTLLYPRNYSENQYPGPADTDPQIILRQASTIRISPPFGLDTMILLSTAQPLPDPQVLDFEGVAHVESRGNQSPLERLLSNASSGTRGSPGVEIPTDWGIEYTTLRSVPGPAAP